jgi:hypothetical protein
MAVLCAEAGAESARSFLERLRAPNALVAQVVARSSSARWSRCRGRAPAPPTAAGARRAGVGAELLRRVARADHVARVKLTLGDEFPEGRPLLGEIERLRDPRGGPPDAWCSDATSSRAGSRPDEFAQILARCREVQDETGWTDAEAILRRAR